MHAILVANAKGGSGKTTLATNLAVAFAAGGKTTALADTDRQRSALRWCRSRPDSTVRVHGLDWTRDRDDVPKDIERLVIDSPAGATKSMVEGLVRRADLVVVPILPSIFDEQASARFIARIERIKAIRKNRKGVAVVANRLRPRTRAGERLETFIRNLGYVSAARIPESALYGELACEGLSPFDINTRQACDNALHWLPLLQYIEASLRTANRTALPWHQHRT